MECQVPVELVWDGWRDYIEPCGSPQRMFSTLWRSPDSLVFDVDPHWCRSTFYQRFQSSLSPCVSRRHGTRLVEPI